MGGAEGCEATGGPEQNCGGDAEDEDKGGTEEGIGETGEAASLWFATATTCCCRPDRLGGWPPAAGVAYPGVRPAGVLRLKVPVVLGAFGPENTVQG